MQRKCHRCGKLFMPTPRDRVVCYTCLPLLDDNGQVIDPPTHEPTPTDKKVVKRIKELTKTCGHGVALRIKRRERGFGE